MSLVQVLLGVTALNFLSTAVVCSSWWGAQKHAPFGEDWP